MADDTRGHANFGKQQHSARMDEEGIEKWIQVQKKTFTRLVSCTFKMVTLHLSLKLQLVQFTFEETWNSGFVLDSILNIYY